MFCNLKIDEKEAEMKKNESESYMDTVGASGAVVVRETGSSSADPPPSNQDNDNNGSSTAA